MQRYAEQIAKAMLEAGAEDAEVDRSGLSQSCYVTIFDDRLDGCCVGIRVSDHTSRPTYERANPSDYHVGTAVRRDGRIDHFHQDTDGDWLDAVAWCCRRLGVDPPSRITHLIDRRDQAIARRNERVRVRRPVDSDSFYRDSAGERRRIMATRSQNPDAFDATTRAMIESYQQTRRAGTRLKLWKRGVDVDALDRRLGLEPLHV